MNYTKINMHFSLVSLDTYKPCSVKCLHPGTYVLGEYYDRLELALFLCTWVFNTLSSIVLIDSAIYV